MANTIPRAWRLTGRRPIFDLSFTKHSSRVRLKPVHNTHTRLYNTSQPLQEYPIEGVFQPNSPSRPLPQQRQQPNTYLPQSNRPPSPHYSPEPPPPPPPSSSRTSLFLSWATRLVVFISFTAFGFTYLTAEGLSRAPLPFAPDSPDDHEELQLLAEEYDALPIVQDLRSLFQIDPRTKERIHVWKEWVAYRGLSDPTSRGASLERRENMLSTGPLKGSQGLAAQSVFYNEESGQVIVIVNFGEGTCGWPGVVHGGAIATVGDEGLGRVAMKSVVKDAPTSTSMFESQEAGKGEEGDTRDAKKSVVTARLETQYLEKCEPGQWYILLCQLGTGTGDPDQNTREVLLEVDHTAPQTPTSFTSIGAGRSQRGFSRPGPTAPSEPTSNTLNPPLPSSPNPPKTTPSAPAGKPSPASVDRAEDESELNLGFRRSTDRKKYALGLLFCASEDGPTLGDIEDFTALGAQGSEASKKDFESHAVHVHAIVQGLWIVREGLAGPPEEF